MNMIYSFFIIFAPFFIVFATSSPTTSDGLGADYLDISDNPELQPISDNPSAVDCNADVPTTDQDQNIVRRSATACPINLGGLWQQWTKKKEHEQIIETRRKDRRCTVSHQQTVLTCGGPEVWAGAILQNVLNCILGDKNEIAARELFVKTTDIGLYCCYALNDWRPAWAGLQCNKIGGTTSLARWTYDDYLEFLEEHKNPPSLQGQ